MAIKWVSDRDDIFLSQIPGGSDALSIPHLLSLSSSFPSRKVIANALILRLVEAFHAGPNRARLSIVSLLLLQSRQWNQKHVWKCIDILEQWEHDTSWLPSNPETLFRILQAQEIVRPTDSAEGQKIDVREGVRDWLEGFLDHSCILNPGLILRRLLSAGQTADPTARCLTLRMIACFSDMAANNVDIFKTVLDGLISSLQCEVMAALFASFFLAAASPDFAQLALPYICHLAQDQCRAISVRRSAIFFLCFLSSSSPLAIEAQKAGEYILSRSPGTDLKAWTLVSLSLLARQSEASLSIQVKLLLTELTCSLNSQIRSVALACLCGLADVAPVAICSSLVEPFLWVLACPDAAPGMHSLSLNSLVKLSLVSSLLAQQMAASVSSLPTHFASPMAALFLQILHSLHRTPSTKRDAFIKSTLPALQRLHLMIQIE